nr:MAG TPA: NinB protein [Caudoviricetes sp.]
MVGTANKLITYLIEQTKDKEFELKEYTEKRSLNANAYCWVLCDKIAKELSKDGTVTTKEIVYKDAITQIGSFEPMIIEEKAFENFERIWSRQGLGFIVQEVSRKDKCIRVNCYYGSSTYNTKEMSLLINLLVELAESLNIETKSENEINSLLEKWK